MTAPSSSSSPTLSFSLQLEESERDRREALESCCQEIQEVWLGADAAVMRQSRVWKEALRILAKLCAGGRTSWKGPEPFKKGIQDYQVREEVIKKRRGRETVRAGESGKERGSRDEKMIQAANKLRNEHRANKERKSNSHTGEILEKIFYRSLVWWN